MYFVNYLLLVLFFCVQYAHAQISTDLTKLETTCGFGHYLLKDNDYQRAANEFERCYALGLCQDHSNDTLQLFAAWGYRLANDFERSNFALKKIHSNNDGIFSIGQAVLSLNYFDKRDNKKSIGIIESVLRNNQNTPHNTFYQTLKTANYIHLNKQERINQGLAKLPEHYYTRLKHINEGYNLSTGKSPLLAATLSAILPGLGKAYTGRYLDGLYSLIMVGASAWQSFSNFQNKGFDSVGFYIYGGIALYFYGGNVYGSALSAEEYNFNRRQQFERDLDEIIHKQF